MAQLLPLTQKAAREVGSKRYFTGKPCKYGHIADRNTKNGTCYECSSLRGKDIYKANSEHIKQKTRAWAVANKDRVAEFSKAYREANRELLRDNKSKYYFENADSIKERVKQWKVDNPILVRAQSSKRRAAKIASDGEYSGEDVDKLFKRQGGRCAVCFEKLMPDFHVDHIIPLSRGGSNWPTNIQITCPLCNLQKGAKDPYDFMRERGLLL